MNATQASVLRLSVLVWLLVWSQATLASADLNADNRALVERLVADRAAAIVAVQRKADEREEKLWVDLAAKDRKLRSEIRSRTVADAPRADCDSRGAIAASRDRPSRPAYSNGFRISSPHSSKSRTLRVATGNRRALAIAAI